MSSVTFKGHLFSHNNPEFLVPETSISLNNIKNITITLMDKEDKKKICNIIKLYNNKYGFSVWRDHITGPRNINLKILIDKKHPTKMTTGFINCIYDTDMLYLPLYDLLDKKYEFTVCSRKMIIIEKDVKRMSFYLREIKPL